MFLTYLRRELRQRARQAVFIALGLAVGIGLVLTVTSASTGVKTAQSKVLDSLYGVGTDITVTKTASPGSGGAPSIKFGGGTSSGSGSKQSIHDSFSKSSLSSMGYGTLKESYVDSIAKLAHVSSVSGALVLTETSVSGNLSASEGSGSGSGSAGGSAGGSISTSSTTVDGVDLSSTSTGVLSSATIVSGHTFTSSDKDSDVAVVSKSYAAGESLKVGSTVTVAGTKFTVIGIESGASAEVYIPLARAQALSDMKNEVNTIYVSADSSANISTVAKEISSAVPSSTVTTSASLAKEVTGSLSSASSLINSLGKWLSIAVLIAAFGLAGLMTMSAVSRRVREFGTLKAIGWPSGRVVRQILGESLVIGIIGGAAGVLLGFAGAEIINTISPPLSASTSSTSTGGTAGAFGGSGGGSGSGSGGPGGHLASAASDITVHLTASMTLGAIALAVVLAIAGGLIAGGLGGWRATRLSPADAFTSVT
jgi:putative ABC transport system permease protein